MDKERCMQRIVKTGIIAVVRAEGPAQALNIAEAVRQGGVDIIEITMTVPGALEVIRQLLAAYPGGEMLIGAGTVLDSETARAAMLAGAEYVVSPHFNPEVVRLCKRYRKVCMPGAMTVTEIIIAMEAGADVIKLFPGNVLGPDFVKAVRGPLPYARLIPTGGVSLENVDRWIKNGCIAVGVGSELTAGAKKGDFEQITATARQFIEKIRATKQDN